MLQFWLPRTPRFEEAVLGSLRWPFLFQDFDTAAEKVTIRILETLARFENIDELPRDVVTSILVNDALRGKLAMEGDVQKQVELVREALVEENQEVRSELSLAAQEVDRLKRELAGKDTEARQLRESSDQDKKAANEMLVALQEERRQRQVAEDSLRGRDAERDRDRARREFVMLSVAALVILVLVAGVFIRLSNQALRLYRAAPLVYTIILLVWSWGADAWGQRKPAVKDWRPYGRFRNLRIGLFGLLAWVIGWNWFEKLGRMLLDWFR